MHICTDSRGVALPLICDAAVAQIEASGIKPSAVCQYAGRYLGHRLVLERWRYKEGPQTDGSGALDLSINYMRMSCGEDRL